MWSPTHVQVTVLKALGLLIKGKNNTNDCFVTIALGKTKYQTSVKEKASENVEWHEECELPIPDQGNTAEIILTVLHRNFLGVDEFLGRINIPLNTLDVYERPKNRTYILQSKQGQEAKIKDRGKLDVVIAFNVKSGSLVDLSKKEKHKTSIGQLSHLVGGSLLSIGSAEKRKGIKKFAKSIGSKMNLRSKKKDGDDDSSVGSSNSLRNHNPEPINKSRQTVEDADPGVVSEDDDEFTFDDLSHKSSGSSLNQPSPANNNTKNENKANSVENLSGETPRRYTLGAMPPVKPPRVEVKQDEWDLKLYGKQSKNLLKPGSSDSLNRRSWESPKLSSRIEEEESTDSQDIAIEDSTSSKSNKSPEPNIKIEKESMFSKFKNFRKDKSENGKPEILYKNQIERMIVGGENENISTTNNRISNELAQKYEGKSREELILLVCETQRDLEHNKKKLKDLEDYLDELLLRVMETTPKILQNPYAGCKYGLNNKLKLEEILDADKLRLLMKLSEMKLV